MNTWRLRDLLEATAGECLCRIRDDGYRTIGTDSRTIRPGDIFVALIGENHDGHRFIDAAIENGAKAIILNPDAVGEEAIRRWALQGIACIAVSDTLTALGDLARYHRNRMNVGVVAVTGSNGKTTTKNLTAAVLGQCFPVLATEGNFNNLIGVPLTLFRLNPEHRWAVIEMGMNRPGEIDRLGAIASPDIGIITNVAPAHLEGLGSIERVALAKAELMDHVREAMVLNADDPMHAFLANRCQTTIVSFGNSDGADIRATRIEQGFTDSRFLLHIPGYAPLGVHLHLAGPAMISNALAAAAAGFAAGLGPDAIVRGLEGVRPVPGRMYCIDTPGGIRLIDDTYNANPGSMKAALSALAPFCRERRIFLILGDMFELGEAAASLHREIGREAGKTGVFRLWATGAHATDVVSGAMDAGMDGDALMAGTPGDLVAGLKALLAPGDWVLVKGSRGMRMETIVSDIRQWLQEG
ncbi:UDP-N-acetylmuramoyl-tripeptide--D-alanyl-D-alanine ligase [Desulfatirhabdium butyrativorans]|uniref:UDP-N-acetylmuramoyl-tripeptide--D-alanyl-D- alanine ligase n=1 Tax=Desulfatirhabdium butyrativorans TaxID=340467 RepID=UPI00047F15C7|nr:UDP-N-acetylmuramoyl-tripeptide--D-alanyl-D-alanine ligase [Desulfatirhabdium butyrativorans]